MHYEEPYYEANPEAVVRMQEEVGGNYGHFMPRGMDHAGMGGFSGGLLGPR